MTLFLSFTVFFLIYVYFLPNFLIMVCTFIKKKYLALENYFFSFQSLLWFFIALKM